MIRNIVFDISNVLAPFRFQEYLQEKGFDAAMMKRIFKASAMTPYWTEFERGRLTDDEVIAAFISADPAIEAELHAAFDHVDGMMGTYDYTEGWLRALKAAGYRLYCITNFTPAGFRQCYDKISFVEGFDGCVYSFEEGFVKPEPEIYRVLLERFALAPEDCVFIDDTEANVLAARQEGLAGIVFRSYEQAAAELRELGVRF